MSIILGGIIGAGFATGQEIYLFFGRFKIYGIIGAFFSSFFIAYILNIVLKQIKKHNINTYEEYMGIIFKNNKIFSYFNKNIIVIFLLFTFYIMELGFASLLFEEYHIPKFMSLSAISFLSYLVFIGNTKSVVNINVILVPILIVFLLILSIFGVFEFTFYENNVDSLWLDFLNCGEANFKFFISSSLYASYNLIMLLPLVISLKENHLNDFEIKGISVVIFFIIFILILFLIMFFNIINVINVEIPLIFVTKVIGNEVLVRIAIVLVLVAIFTSVVCVGHSFLCNITSTKKMYKKFAFIICISGIILSNMSFSNMMKIIYSILGFLGIIQILAIVLEKKSEN